MPTFEVAEKLQKSCRWGSIGNRKSITQIHTQQNYFHNQNPIQTAIKNSKISNLKSSKWRNPKWWGRRPAGNWCRGG
ncbi:hypothetical protein Patl1_04566 [Pistacia atlantica]|uniref:Uncharacterized protein n=1 Tax=Pistacia atlantica TaxID=434234 RepID=A0ACC1BW61_9ROSI|nr:hypothetical protein Patl1_04566 [Pistacia atlantica]